MVTIKTIILKLIIVFSVMAIVNGVYAQEQPKIFINHLYFVFDSITFSHLFEDTFLLKIGDTSTSSTTTTTDSWTGKYLSGKNTYFEFFSSSNFKHVPEYGFGFGFITNKSGDINQIKMNWKNSIPDSVETDTAISPINGKLLPWYYSISLYNPDSLQTISTWLMENTPEELKGAGFAVDEVKHQISWQEYVEKMRKKKFSKPFNRISVVELTISTRDYDYLKKSLLGFGLKDDGKRFYNEDITIKYTLSNTYSTKLKSAMIVLDSTLPKRSIVVSSHLMINVNGKIAVFKFND